MKDVKVTYNPQKEKPPRSKALSLNGVRLNPGVNVLSSKSYEKIINNPGYQERVFWGAIAVDNPPSLTNKEDPLFDMSASEISSMVVNLSSVEDLQKLRDQESNGKARKGVLNSIDKQLKKLAKNQDDDGELEDDQGEEE